MKAINMKKFSISGTAAALIMVALGIVLLLVPGLTLTLILRIIGGALLAIGLVRLIPEIREKQRGAVGNSVMIGACCFVAAGLVLLIAPGAVAGILPLAAGLLILLSGVLKFVRAFDEAKGKSRNIMLVIAAVTVLCGLLIFANPFGTAEMLVRALGIILIYNGASSLWMSGKKKIGKEKTAQS